MRLKVLDNNKNLLLTLYKNVHTMFKWQSKDTVLTGISAAALIKFFARQVRRLIEGGAYLKIGPYKEIISF